MKTQWWLSTEMIAKPGSQKEAGPFTTRDDAFNARVALERRGCNLSVFEEEVKPLVTNLPVYPTLGWLDSTGNDHALGIWKTQQLTGGMGIGNERGGGNRALDVEITAFTEAVAVPKAALDELREWFEAHPRMSSRVNAFLAAVDEAN